VPGGDVRKTIELKRYAGKEQNGEGESDVRCMMSEV
jgi:hypothetical protein